MAKDLIRYDLLVQDALKKVVRKILSDTAKSGLPGDHHFYISFRTDVPGVRLSQRMRDKYPQEMTVVLQHQFWDLGVTEHAFEVGLSFSGVPERLLVPFDAVTGFFDPSVQFGLKFEIRGEAAESDEAASKPVQPTRGAASEPAEIAPKPPGASPNGKAPAVPAAGKSAVPQLPAKAKATDKTPPTEQPEKADGETPAAQVVSLDAFRKKS